MPSKSVASRNNQAACVETPHPLFATRIRWRASMNPWVELGVAEIPDNGGQLKLSRRGDEYAIRLSGIRGDLMNSRMHGSEEALADLGCEGFAGVENARVLIGGLGMGFTLMAALKCVAASACITVAELLPDVVQWNRGPLGDCAGNPLTDPRVGVHIGDVADLVVPGQKGFDVILLDVDNGPEGLTHTNNDWLYSLEGLAALYKSLHPQGTLAVWSAGADPMFLIRLKKAGFHTAARTVRARPGKGARHTIFVARKTPAIGGSTGKAARKTRGRQAPVGR